jgi:hypothetical protein
VVVVQLAEHLAVPDLRQDALDDGVVAAVEGVPRELPDGLDVGAVGLVQFLEDDPADVVLLDPRDTAAMRLADAFDDGTLSRTGVAPDDDECWLHRSDSTAVMVYQDAG